MYKNILNSEDSENENNKSEVKDKIENVKELGNTDLANPNRKIQVLSIIGQIEGHSVLPPQTKLQNMNILFHN